MKIGTCANQKASQSRPRLHAEHAKRVRDLRGCRGAIAAFALVASSDPGQADPGPGTIPGLRSGTGRAFPCASSAVFDSLSRDGVASYPGDRFSWGWISAHSLRRKFCSVMSGAKIEKGALHRHRGQPKSSSDGWSFPHTTWMDPRIVSTRSTEYFVRHLRITHRSDERVHRRSRMQHWSWLRHGFKRSLPSRVAEGAKWFCAPIQFRRPLLFIRTGLTFVIRFRVSANCRNVRLDDFTV